MSIPLVMSSTGPVPTSAISLHDALISGVAATNPGYTANLPGSLIEDISSTDVGALLTIDQARVDAVNNVTPYGANPFVLAQLGAQAGIPQGQPTNTSVYVVFAGLAGYVIPAGFLVSDGTYQYAVQDGAVIATGGTTPPVYCVAIQSGSWAIPVGTVTSLASSVPAGYTLTVTNPLTGTPGSASESVQSYRARVVLAGQVAGQGTPAYIRTLLGKVPGINPRLISVIPSTQGWEVICGGGDPYLIAGAIYLAVLDLSSIVGSATTARNITVSIQDAPNIYPITFVNPPMQTVTMAIVWNTSLLNFSGASVVSQTAIPALQNYINSITVGQPINLFEMQIAFQSSIATIVPTQYLTALVFSVYINGVLTAPNAGTEIIASDSESYFYALATGITVTQG